MKSSDNKSRDDSLISRPRPGINDATMSDERSRFRNGSTLVYLAKNGGSLKDHRNYRAGCRRNWRLWDERAHLKGKGQAEHSQEGAWTSLAPFSPKAIKLKICSFLTSAPYRSCLCNSVTFHGRTQTSCFFPWRIMEPFEVYIRLNLSMNRAHPVADILSHPLMDRVLSRDDQYLKITWSIARDVGARGRSIEKAESARAIA
jgi:hypothetical protein